MWQDRFFLGLLVTGITLLGWGAVFADFDLLLDKSYGGGVVHSGDVVRFYLSGSLTADSEEQGDEVIVTDTLHPFLLFTGTWGVDAPYSVGFPLIDLIENNDHGPLTWAIYTMEAGAVPYRIWYDVVVLGTGMVTNTGMISPGMSDPEDTNLTNNTDVVMMTVLDDPVDGVCGFMTGLGLYDLVGEGNGFVEYQTTYPLGTGLCMGGNSPTLATDPTYFSYAYEWICRGANGGDDVSCSAPELFCGDGISQITSGEECDDGNQTSNDGCSSDCKLEQVRLVEALPRSGLFTIMNYGITSIDLSGYRLLLGGDELVIDAGDIVEGALLLDPGDFLVVSGGVSPLTGGDIGFFYPTGALTSTATLIDYVQWGASGQATEMLAVEKGIREIGTYLDEVDPFVYIGNGVQTGIVYRADTAHSCGDGVLFVDNSESCDDGNLLVGDGCDDLCQIEEGRMCEGAFPSVCGDIYECQVDNGGCDHTCTELLGSYECSCDAGYLLDDDEHSCIDANECLGEGGGNNCSDYATCDNTLGSFECSCDSGFTGDGVTCTAVCGDGLVLGDEVCDDNNTIDGDGCNSSCQRENPFCALSFNPTNGSVPLEVMVEELLASGSDWIIYDELDRGDETPIFSIPMFPLIHEYTAAGTYIVTLTVESVLTGFTATCTGSITVNPVCGNGVLEVGEVCDDGNTANGDTCTSTCALPIGGGGGGGGGSGGGGSGYAPSSKTTQEENVSIAVVIKRYTRSVSQVLTKQMQSFSLSEYIKLRNIHGEKTEHASPGQVELKSSPSGLKVLGWSINLGDAVMHGSAAEEEKVFPSSFPVMIDIAPRAYTQPIVPQMHTASTEEAILLPATKRHKTTTSKATLMEVLSKMKRE